ncbi:hypothetical protein BH11BAC3_BH11BAC3_27530 [soil metagenome]
MITIQLLLGFRVNHLFWKNMYISTKRVSLRRLKEALINATNFHDKKYVELTIYLYYLQKPFL